MKNSRRNRGYTPQEKKTYKVVGWTDYDDDYFPDSDGGDGVFDAVVEAVREGSYLFGGDSHQDMSGCCPVLNDGTKVCFSWRGWGGVIAAAYDQRGSSGRLDHMCGYMDDMIVEDAIIRPSKFVDYTEIDDEKSKTHALLLPPTQGILYGWKRFDMRVDDDTVKDIKQFDYIDFLDVNFPTDNKYGYSYAECSRVREIVRGASFEEILDTGILDDYYCSESDAGYDDCNDRESLLKALYNDYPREKVQEHGAVCFMIHPKRDNEHQY